MEIIGRWISGICAGALICGIAQAVTPKINSAAAARLACGFMMLALLLGPLRSFDFQTYASELGRIRNEGNKVAEQAMSSGDELFAAVMENDCETYILDKANKLGVINASVRVHAAQGENEEYPYPYSAELGGEAESGQKRELSLYIEGELGIPAQRQYWSDEDEH